MFQLLIEKPGTPIFIAPLRECFRNLYLSKGNFADNNFHKMKRYYKETDYNFRRMREAIFGESILSNGMRPSCRRLSFMRLKATKSIPSNLQRF